MPSTSTSQERRTTNAIHYKYSYIVQNAEYGSDGAIVLLHDLPAGAFAWENVMPQLVGLKRAVYAIDMLGYGNSDHPWPADTSTWGQADGLALLFKNLNLKNIILVGHGVGGGVAQILATRLYHEQVAALVLVDTIAYLHAFSENWPLPEMAKRQDFDAPKEASLEEVIHDLRNTLGSGVVKVKEFANVIDKYIEPWNSEVGKEVLYQHIRLLIPSYTNAVSTDLAVFQKPVLIIWGEKDQQMPIKIAERLHREIAHSKLAVIHNAGHLIPFDAPEAVASEIKSFVEAL
ncbi:alpha/beta fold hydrolase [Ktedonospora formicarum]|uniref:Oxidoreductase n=1 Tax=Ktedonospora formicarum TaxID=2778364 RepID=A0A8J3I1F6_9CHLR|nr:alpha/beta hydrolase [Ktedonospora formicarum]GHO44313.1 oxidoreductase [Ktedonospora formicarum]